MVCFPGTALAQQGTGLDYGDFQPGAPQGFGDRQTSMAWSMEWWQGQLYVGTSRSYGCYLRAILVTYYPWQQYPPLDSEIECTPDPVDLPLGAEIWRWTPETDLWEKVYESPKTLPIPGHPGKFISPSIGFRDMHVFTEPDGTEALYVAGFTARDLYNELPPPQILRSTDGVTFTPIPQEPGTFLGDLTMLEGLLLSGFNRLNSYNGRFYASIGGAYGHGILLESANPVIGNDNFQIVSPPGETVTAFTPYNDYLYVALGSNPIPGEPPFRLLKTKASGTLPYQYTEVIAEGGYRTRPSTTIVSMYEFKGRLWVTTNRLSEVLRVNPDDTWDVMVGQARETPTGWKYPLSGLTDGFGWTFNIHIHTLRDHEGWLYLASNDQSNTVPMRNIPWLAEQIGDRYGFDLYRTTDGQYFYPVTVAGFEERSFDFSGRNMASTPYGLFVGTMNYHYGMNIWRGTKLTGATGESRAYLPIVAVPATSRKLIGPMTAPVAAANANPVVEPTGLASPAAVESEDQHGLPLLSWEPVTGATTYRVYRSTITSVSLSSLLNIDPAISEMFFPIEDLETATPYQQVITTAQPFVVDTTAVAGQTYYYYVVAESGDGLTSMPSNMARVPTQKPPATLTELRYWFAGVNPGDELNTTRSQTNLHFLIEDIEVALAGGDFLTAKQQVNQLAQLLQTEPPSLIAPWQVEDVSGLLARFARRLDLAQAGLLPAQELLDEAVPAQ